MGPSLNQTKLLDLEDVAGDRGDLCCLTRFHLVVCFVLAKSEPQDSSSGVGGARGGAGLHFNKNTNSK